MAEEVDAGLGLAENLVLWAGFAGAWLLVAGPLHQARVELAEEQLQQDSFRPAFDRLGPPPRLSVWWWLLPPLRLYLGHRAKEKWQRELWLTLPDQDFEALSSFMAKARGWMLVGGGGLLIATKETWELVEGHGWPGWVFWVLVAGMAAVCVGLTVVQATRETSLAEERQRQTGPAGQHGEATGEPEAG